jgi:hypothetical protein
MVNRFVSGVRGFFVGLPQNAGFRISSYDVKELKRPKKKIAIKIKM